MSKSASRRQYAAGDRRSSLLIGLMFAALVALGAPIASAAAEDPVRSDAPGIYVVRTGDTLWDIARVFLDEPWRWPELWRVNPQIENPHLIYPGDSIRLRYVDGEPRLELSRGDAARTVRLSPSDTVRLQPRVRATPLLSSIPTIDLDAIGPFLTANRVVESAILDGAPYVVQGEAGRILVGANDRLYARGLDAVVGDSFSVLRPSGEYVDPDTGEVLGAEGEELGTVQVTAVQDDLATLLVTASRADIRIGDRVLPSEERAVNSAFFPSAPGVEVNGKMLAVLDGVSQIGQYSVVALNVGGREGVEVGNVLAVLKTGPLVRDRIAGDVVQMPSERAGLLMVFRVFERVSYGIVLQSERPLAVLDEVVNP